MRISKPRPIRARRRPGAPPMALYAGLVVAAGALLTIAGTRATPDEESAPAPADIAAPRAADNNISVTDGADSDGAVTDGAVIDGAIIDGVVTRVVDGDTFHMTGAQKPIRVWGLDAPEASGAGGPEATVALARLASGKRLSCQTMDVDRYERIVGRCTLANGDDIAALMIESGTATEYLRYSKGYYGRRRP